MSQIHSPSQRVLTKVAFNTAITAAANTSAAIDTLLARRAQAIFCTSPSGSGTTSDCKLQESDVSGSGYVDVATAAFTQGTTVAGLTIQVMDIDLSKRKRYLKLIHTGAGGSAAGQAVGIIQLFGEAHTAVSQDITPVAV